jgi:hypothetical protein
MILRPRNSTLTAVAALVALAALLALAACGDDKNKVDPRVAPAGSAAFKDGYAAGCAVGIRDADHPGDRLQAGATSGAGSERYAKDLEFKRGWDKGYFACYDDENS